jgi:membrane-associated phospholipid phosphatase
MAAPILWIGFFERIWQWLDYVDTKLFLKINMVYTNSFLDGIFPVWREATTWIPLYFFLILFVSINYKLKAIPWILLFILTITISDQISSGILKNWIGRPRPCNDPFLQFYMRLLLSRCPSSGSFTSSHATNHFAAAMFLWITLKPVFKKWGKLFFIWAATICYGQVYVGVHYPLDILGGCLLGCIIGFGSAWLFNKKIGLPPFETAIALQ